MMPYNYVTQRRQNTTHKAEQARHNRRLFRWQHQTWVSYNCNCNCNSIV